MAQLSRKVQIRVVGEPYVAFSSIHMREAEVRKCVEGVWPGQGATAEVREARRGWGRKEVVAGAGQMTQRALSAMLGASNTTTAKGWYHVEVIIA